MVQSLLCVHDLIPERSVACRSCRHGRLHGGRGSRERQRRVRRFGEEEKAGGLFVCCFCLFVAFACLCLFPTGGCKPIEFVKRAPAGVPAAGNIFNIDGDWESCFDQLPPLPSLFINSKTVGYTCPPSVKAWNLWSEYDLVRQMTLAVNIENSPFNALQCTAVFFRRKLNIWFKTVQQCHHQHGVFDNALK